MVWRGLYIIDLLSERVSPTAPGNFQVGESLLDTPWVFYQLYIFASAGYIPTSASSLTEMARGETSTSSTMFILLNPHVFDSPWNIWKHSNNGENLHEKRLESSSSVYIYTV